MADDKSLFNESFRMRDASHQKRKKARTPVLMDGEFQLENKNQAEPCQLTDLGTGGLSMVTRSPLYQGDRLTVRFPLNGRPVALAGQVSRVSGKTVGVQFDGLSEDAVTAIQHYIHKAFFDPDKKKA